MRVDGLADEDCGNDSRDPPGYHNTTENANGDAEGRCREQVVKK